MSRVRQVALAAAGAALALSSCSGTPLAGSVSSPSRPGSSPSTDPSPAPTPDPSSDPSPAPSLPPCTDATLTGVGTTLDAQFAAFAARDFRAAFALASESFRSGVDLTAFRRLIRQDYPEVADAAGYDVIECVEYGSSAAAARVDVTGANGRTVQLAYRFVAEPDGWHVDGASTLGQVTTAVV